MAILFATDEWAKAIMAKVNESQAYREAAKTWEGDFYFVVEPALPALPEARYMYLDLWHGMCREAFLSPDLNAKRPEFIVRGPLAVWRKVIGKQVDPIQALITRQLKLEGPLIKVMKAPRATLELVNCATRVETIWP